MKAPPNGSNAVPELTLQQALDQAPSAMAATRLRWRGRALRHGLVVGALCLGIALLLTALEGHGFFTKLTYSVCIAAACVVLVDLSRFATAWASDRLRSARGLPYRDSARVAGWRGVIPGALLAMLLGPPAGLWLGDRITGFESPSLLAFGSSATRLTLSLSVLATVVSVAVLSLAERLATARAQAEAAQRAAAENQLRLLQSQLEPHMLFNTLANLRVLIGLNPHEAQAMLDHLIAFLRATLNASRQASHPLSTEFAHLADYLALMAMRMGPRLAVQLRLPPELAALPVPPLLLQPLVENAVKHGLEPKVDGGRIEVAAERIGAGPGQRLRLVVRDTGVGLAQGAGTAGTQFGLEQVRQRLTALHGERARFTLQAAEDDEGGTLAVVELPLDPAA